MGDLNLDFDVGTKKISLGDNSSENLGFTKEIETTNFEKLVELTSKEKSAIIDRVWLNGIIGSVVTWASIDWLSDLVIFLLPLGLYFLYKSFDAYSSLSNPPKRVPDQEALNRRKLKEDELRAGRDKFLRDAKIQFRATN